MAKNNEFVGVDEQFIPESEKNKQHTSESIISDDAKNQIRDTVRSGVDKMTSDEGKEKIKSGAKTGLKIFKGIGIGYLIMIILGALLAIGIIVFAIIMIGNMMSQQNQMMQQGQKIYDSATEMIQDGMEKTQEENKNMKDSNNSQSSNSEKESNSGSSTHQNSNTNNSDFDEQYQKTQEQIEETQRMIEEQRKNMGL